MPLTHHYALFLCSLDVEIDYNLVGLLTACSEDHKCEEKLQVLLLEKINDIVDRSMDLGGML